MSSDVRFGWLERLDVPAALEAAPSLVVGAGWALLSMVDSCAPVADLPSVAPTLARHGIDPAVVGGSVAVPTRVLPRLADDGFLNGFDEVWLFVDAPVTDKPATAAHLTSDRPLREPPASELVEWMGAAGCVIGLGDGDGLNYVTLDVAVAEEIERLRGHDYG